MSIEDYDPIGVTVTLNGRSVETGEGSVLIYSDTKEPVFEQSKVTRMSYSLTKLEAELESAYKNISWLEDNKESLEGQLAINQESLTTTYENVKDLEQTISKLKGETK